MRFVARSPSPSLRSSGATGASGWPSTTEFLATRGAVAASLIRHCSVGTKFSSAVLASHSVREHSPVAMRAARAGGRRGRDDDGLPPGGTPHRLAEPGRRSSCGLEVLRLLGAPSSLGRGGHALRPHCRSHQAAVGWVGRGGAWNLGSRQSFATRIGCFVSLLRQSSVLTPASTTEKQPAPASCTAPCASRSSTTRITRTCLEKLATTTDASCCRWQRSLRGDRGIWCAGALTPAPASYAQVYDLELAEVIVDAGESAKHLDRPGLQRALGMLKASQGEYTGRWAPGGPRGRRGRHEAGSRPHRGSSARPWRRQLRSQSSPCSG